MSTFVCAEPLSPSYSTLPRYNTLTLLFFTLISSSNSWATKGALAALMARTATMAFHAVALLRVTHLSSNKTAQRSASNLEPQANTVDLDIIGAWVILSATGTAVPLFLGAAPALKTSRARPLLRLWGILVIVGAVCAFVAVRENDRVASRLGFDGVGEFEPIVQQCRNANHAPLRSGEAFANDAKKVFGRIGWRTLTGKFDITALVVMGFGVYACLRKTAIGSLDSNSKPLRNDSYDGEWTAKSGSRHGAPIFIPLIRRLEVLGLLMATIVVAAIVVLHEIYMLKDGGIPMLESLVAYEQWNCWAATGLVVLATTINWWIGKVEPPVSTTRLGGEEVYETDPVGLTQRAPTHIC